MGAGNASVVSMNEPITTQQIDAILIFLNKFDTNGYSPGTWKNGWLEFTGEVVSFREALYDNGWVQSFDWPNWQKTAEKYVNSPELLESVDVETIRKLFTTHIRKDRFCEGHLAAMFENGHIVALLKRLQQIRNEL